MSQPQYIFSGPNRLRDVLVDSIDSAAGFDVFLDYDGTLTPIRKKPHQAVLSPAMKELLEKLRHIPHLHLTIITGRAMDDIRKLVEIDDLLFAANHGYHFALHGKEWIHPKAAAAIQYFSHLSLLLTSHLSSFPNVLIENKQLTLNIHYRNAAEQHIPGIKSNILNAVHLFDSPLRLIYGKKVVEIRPDIDWNKGNAINAILASHHTHRPYLPIMIGDDTTDEDAFQVLRPRGITIHVGRSRNSFAEYYVKNTDEVVWVLRHIIDLRKQHRSLSTVSSDM